MSRRFRKVSYTKREFFDGKHRFEHWYRDNTIYFITSRTSDRSPAFASDEAKLIFWDRFDYYSYMYGFVPCVTTLMDNHYHAEGYLKVGENLGPFMQHLHGSVAKLVNDTLDVRLVPFWRTAGNKDYFDGCIRDELQMRRAYRDTRSSKLFAPDLSETGASTRTRALISNSSAPSPARTNSAASSTTSPTRDMSANERASAYNVAPRTPVLQSHDCGL